MKKLKRVVYYLLGSILSVIPLLPPIFIEPINEDYISGEYSYWASMIGFVIYTTFFYLWITYAFKAADYILSSSKVRKLKKKLRWLRTVRNFLLINHDFDLPEVRLVYDNYTGDINDIEFEIFLETTHSKLNIAELNQLKKDSKFWSDLSKQLLIDHDTTDPAVKSVHDSYLKEVNKIGLEIARSYDEL